MRKITRRDFIKLAGAASAGALFSKRVLSLRQNSEKKNIIIILWDAFSAYHLSLHGYPRLTTPNIDSFAQYSTVYHNHYSGGNYTTTGTASMLTGMNAWKHRAINYGGLVRKSLEQINPYTLLGSEYHRYAFSQNPWPDRLMRQYAEEVDVFLPPSARSMMDFDSPSAWFAKDRALASIALDDFSLPAQNDSSPAGSALLGYLHKSAALNVDKARQTYRGGVPEIMDPGYLIPYLNETVYKAVYSDLTALDSQGKPFFAYFHLYSPHYPFRPRNDYRQLFRDGYAPAPKPRHPFTAGVPDEYINTQRDLYDRQIAQIDDEFGRLISKLDESGILDNSYLIFTADHGELFERGFVGHGFQLMYEPVLRIPLIIHAPGQTTRADVFSPTSNTDILPTILAMAGKNIPPEIDGRVLPGFGGAEDPQRAVFSVVAVDNSAFAPLKKTVIAMRKHNFKLIAYFGYENINPFELYDIEEDPEERENLAAKDTQTLNAMKEELLAALEEANRNF